MVREEDVELLFKRQRLINETKDIDTLSETLFPLWFRYTASPVLLLLLLLMVVRDHLPAEFRRDVLPIARAQNIADPRV